MEHKCALISNCVREFKNKSEHENFLSEYPALFNRTILYNVLAELGVNVKMSDGLADHTIALYANGFAETTTTMTKEQKNSTTTTAIGRGRGRINQSNVGEQKRISLGDNYKKLTVMSKASFFNVYNLEGGYVCTKYLTALFRKKSCDEFDLGSQLVPVYHLKSLMAHFGLEDHLTWIYFCILCGNTDDPELSRNQSYTEFNNLDVKMGKFCYAVVEDMKIKEKSFKGSRKLYTMDTILKRSQIVLILSLTKN